MPNERLASPVRVLLVAGAASVVVLSAAAFSPRETGTPPARQSAELLGAIGGRWQSDTVGGASAVSDCTWTPQRGAVICEQTITTPTGVRHALDLYTYDPGARKYTFYVLGQPGGVMQPIDLAIDGAVWTYGGPARGGNGNFNRTVNDFSAGDSYTWRSESSPDGEHWTVGAHGRSTRVGR